MIRRPPRSTLFPYTRSSDLLPERDGILNGLLFLEMLAARKQTPSQLLKRSEEHTSELQSQSNLVCRLLLEKKKMTAPVSSVLSAQHAPIVDTRSLPSRILHY